MGRQLKALVAQLHCGTEISVRFSLTPFLGGRVCVLGSDIFG